MLKRVQSENLPDLSGANWIEAPRPGNIVYRLELALAETLDTVFSVAAVPAFRLHLDGRFEGESTLQCTWDRIFHEAFRLKLPPGGHLLEILVPDYQDFAFAPLSRMKHRFGLFCFAGEPAAAMLNTGRAPWRCRVDARLAFEPQRIDFFQCVAGALKFDCTVPNATRLRRPLLKERGQHAQTFRQADTDCRLLDAAPLPPFETGTVTRYRIRQVDTLDREAYSEVNDLGPTFRKLDAALEIPPFTSRRILLEFDNYYCCKYSFRTSGGNGAEIRISWAESLYTTGNEKSNRRDIEAKHLNGLCDRFLPGWDDGYFFNLDYRCGCYAEIFIRNGAENLKIHELEFHESRYPLEWHGSLVCSDPQLERIARHAFRTLQMCCHDTLMDCPYYEQLMYVGDGRLQLLALYVSANDLSIADHAVSLWSESLRHDGLFTSLYPARTCQIIPGFSLICVAAVSDYIRWRNRPEITGRVFPAAVRALMAWEDMKNSGGLIAVTRGWRFADWAEGWDKGVPPLTADGVSGFFNALYLYVLNEFSITCRMLGETELAARFERLSGELYPKMQSAFYHPETGLFSDLPGEPAFSEHTNALMLLSDRLAAPEAERLTKVLFDERKPLTECSPYFSFYAMEAAFRMKRPDVFFRKLRMWHDMEQLGMHTLAETSEPSRSDCHGWSAHVLYHLFASVAGIRPASIGGGRWTAAPQPGSIAQLRGSVPVRNGRISFNLAEERRQFRFPASHPDARGKE